MRRRPRALDSTHHPDQERDMGKAISTLTDTTFDEEIGGSEEVVIVDFWAEWCGPCKMISPILEEIATEQAGKVKIAKLNVDDNPDAARRFEVMSIPTLIVFKDGQPVRRLIGAKGIGKMLRGDDVYELQRELGSLGFDAGRVDGIFGPRTLEALLGFQRNAGVTT